MTQQKSTSSMLNQPSGSMTAEKLPVEDTQSEENSGALSSIHFLGSGRLRRKTHQSLDFDYKQNVALSSISMDDNGNSCSSLEVQSFEMKISNGDHKKVEVEEMRSSSVDGVQGQLVHPKSTFETDGGNDSSSQKTRMLREGKSRSSNRTVWLESDQSKMTKRGAEKYPEHRLATTFFPPKVSESCSAFLTALTMKTACPSLPDKPVHAALKGFKSFYEDHSSVIMRFLIVIYLLVMWLVMFRSCAPYYLSFFSYLTNWGWSLELIYFAYSLVTDLYVRGYKLFHWRVSFDAILSRRLRQQMLAELVFVAQIVIVFLYWTVVYPQCDSLNRYPLSQVLPSPSKQRARRE